jgi:hypothetical protein
VEVGGRWAWEASPAALEEELAAPAARAARAEESVGPVVRLAAPEVRPERAA